MIKVPCQVVEHRDDHDDDGDDQKMIKYFTFGKEEREKQNSMEIKTKVYHRPRSTMLISRLKNIIG
jgi:hypothetical protein